MELRTSALSFNHSSFSRRLRDDEKKEYSQALTEGKSALGVKNLALILHGASFPAGEDDLFVGSHFSKQAKELNSFAKLHGFDAIQLGPNGLIYPSDVRPYQSSILSKNTLFVQMNDFTTPKYASLLTMDEIKKYSKFSKYHPENDRVNYTLAFLASGELFEVAFDNFNKKIEQRDENTLRLNEQFGDFKEKNQDWLDSDAVFDVLSMKNDGKPFQEWDDSERYLMSDLKDESSLGHHDAKKLHELLNRDYKTEMELYKFKQFIIDKQERSFIKENPDKLKYISDSIVGFSSADFWANQEVFLSDYRVGCPWGGPNNSRQAWGIPVLDPKKLFNEDGSIGEGGELLRQKFITLLDNYDSVRIDHAFGLVDPWIYDKNSVERKTDGSVNADGKNISELPEIDPNKDYSKILEKILLPLFKERGVDVEDIVWEDLAPHTHFFYNLYYEQLNLPGIQSIKQKRAENMDPRFWAYVGSHDDPPLSKVIAEGDFMKVGEGNPNDPQYLTGTLHPSWSNDERAKVIDRLTWDKRLRAVMKTTELFLFAKKIQLSFMDFFGLDKTYNVAGNDEEAKNWTLRLTPDYIDRYYKTLENKDYRKIAINMPEILKKALESKKSKELLGKSYEEAGQIEKSYEPILDKLDKFEKILYEKEAD